MSTTSRRLFKSSTSLVTLLISSIVIGFFMMPFLVHSLGDEQYGIWTLVGSIIAFYEIMDMGLSSAIQRYLIRAIHGKDLDDANISLSNSIVLTTAIAVVFLLVTSIIILLTPLFTFSETTITTFQITIAILGLRAAIQFPLFPYYGVLIAHYRQDIIGYIQLTSLYARTILTVFFVYNGFGIITIAIIATLTHIAGSIMIVGFAKKLSPEIGFSFSHLQLHKIKKYYDYGKYVFIVKIGEKIKVSLDNSVVGAMVGLSAITHYTIAITLIQYFGSFIGSLFGVISPALHKYHKLNQWDKLREAFLVTTEVTALTSVLIGGLLITLGGPFIYLWMGDGFSDVYPALLILCTSAIAINAQQPIELVLYAIAKHKYLAFITIIEAIANLTLSIVLAYYIGILGVALGTTIPALINSLILKPRYTCRQLDIAYVKYYGILAKPAISGLFIFIPAHYAKQYLHIDSWIMLFLQGILASIVFLIFYSKFIMDKNTASYIANSVPQKIAPLVRLFVN